MLGRKIQTDLEVSREAKLPLLSGTFILVFLSIFTKSQASSPFEAFNSAHLSKSQMDVRPSVQKRLRTMAFSRFSNDPLFIPDKLQLHLLPPFPVLLKCDYQRFSNLERET